VSYYLPTRVPSYLLRLAHQYKRTDPVLHEVITASRVLVIEETAYERWDGGQHGHDVRLYVPIDVLAKIDIDAQLDSAAGIAEDLRKLAQGAEGEFINAVRLEMEEQDDPDCQRATPFSSRRPLNPDNLSIWKAGLVRVFISHRDHHKAAVHELARYIEPYGLSCFVAHETIPANEEWRKVILNGLETMEVMLVFLTNDFAESVWTMQEVGYALGKGVPIVSFKLETQDPPGFIGHAQALRGSFETLAASAENLVPLLWKALGRQERFQAALVASFVDSPNWTETTSRFDRMDNIVKKLSDTELKAIIEGFRRNDQLHNATYLYTRDYRRLHRFLEKTTGKKFVIEGVTITEA
jgi:hypothetical protein